MYTVDKTTVGASADYIVEDASGTSLELRVFNGEPQGFRAHNKSTGLEMEFRNMYEVFDEQSQAMINRLKFALDVVETSGYFKDVMEGGYFYEKTDDLN